jgi:hypothetical protein
MHPELPLLAPKGFRRIQCGCDRPCPNGLARFEWIESESGKSPTAMDEWYRGRQRALNILAAIDDASPSIHAKQGYSGEALLTVLPKRADNSLQPKRTCGVKEDILQPCNQPALSVFPADQLVQENKADVATGTPQVTLQTIRPVQTPTDILDAE